MLKNLILSSFLLLNLIGIIYPSKKENTKLLDYCFSLEKILTMNSIKNRKDAPQNIKSISSDILKFGVSKTRGALVDNMIDKYKNSKNSKIIKLVPNGVYCYAGYWIETANPGTFESIFIDQSKKVINEFKDLKDLKDDVDVILNDINSEYKVIKKQFNSFF